MPRMLTVADLLGSKKPVIAELMELTCVNVPIPNRPTHMPKNAKIFASHFQEIWGRRFPMPRSM